MCLPAFLVSGKDCIVSSYICAKLKSWHSGSSFKSIQMKAFQGKPGREGFAYYLCAELCLSVDGQFALFLVLSIKNKATMNIHVHVLMWTYVLIFLGCMFRNWTCHIRTLTFWGTAKLFSECPYHFIFTPAMRGLISTHLAQWLFIVHLYYSHPHLLSGSITLCSGLISIFLVILSINFSCTC